ALHGDVVDAVVHQIFADGVMAAGHERELEFRADAIGGRDEDGIAVSVQTKATAEAADIGKDVGVEGGLGHRADGFYGAIGFVDINSSVLVTYLIFLRHLLRYLRENALHAVAHKTWRNPARRSEASGAV